jgi:nucleotide-binding universal stress UspA family protein
VPVDGSPTSKLGLRHAAGLAKPLGARIRFLHVIDELKWPADVICMGTHGRRGLNRLLLGSDAARVLRETPVPVPLVRSEEKS